MYYYKIHYLYNYGFPKPCLLLHEKLIEISKSKKAF